MKKEAVMSWLRSHEQEQIEFLQQMIRIPSVTGNEGPIQEFMAKTLTEMGLAVDSFVPSLEELQKHPAYVAPAQPYEGRPDVVGTLKGAGGGRSLLFNGHIDVIPEGSLDNWQHDPWSADIADGKMYGRGTSDMKSGAAATLIRHGGKVSRISATTFPLGLEPEGEASVRHVMLYPDDIILMLSDGVSEETYPLIRQLLESSSDLEQIVMEICDKAEIFAGGNRRDDVTVCAARLLQS